MFKNGSRVDVASSQSNVRGEHPDQVILDDVLEDESATSELMRRRTSRLNRPGFRDCSNYWVTASFTACF